MQDVCGDIGRYQIAFSERGKVVGLLAALLHRAPDPPGAHPVSFRVPVRSDASPQECVFFCHVSTVLKQV